jgi:putative addiction module component (TIGR02574 family)
MSATMTPKAHAILDQAMELSANEREFIALRLLESIDPPPNSYASEEELRAEIKRRIEDIESSKVKALTLEEAMANIRKAREDCV